MSTFKRFALRCFVGFVLVMSLPSALAGAPVKIICPCTFEQFDQTAARVEFELGFIEQVETSGLLSLEVVHMPSRDLFSAAGYHSLGRASLGKFEFSSDLTTVLAQIPLRAREVDEGFLALVLWSDQSAFPLDQVLLGPELVAIDTSYGIYPFDSPSIMFSSGLDFAFGFEGAQLTIGEIFSPDLAGTQETWALELVVADSEGAYFSKATVEVSVNFDADGKASIARNIDFDEDLQSHLSFNEDFTEIVLMLYRNGDLYLRYWLGSLDGLPAPSLIPVIHSIDAVSDTDGDGLTDYIEGLVGTSPDLIDTLSQAEIEIAFTYGTTASDEFGSDMEARVAHIIDVSNLALENSGVAARVELTDLIEIGNDSGLTASALISAMGNRTGLFDGLDEKFSRKPDLIIHLGLIDVIETGGLANLLGGLNDGIFDGVNYSSSGLNVGVVGLDNADTTLIHEIGHLLGLDHSRVQGTAEGAFPWSLGHGLDESFVTIMGYPEAFSDAPEVAFFSSPELPCDRNSTPCGIDRTDLINGADAARSLATAAFQAAAISNGFSPVVRFVGGAETSIENEEAVARLIFEIVDAEDGSLTAAAQVEISASALAGFDFEQIVRVTDSDGNSVEAVRLIKVDASATSEDEVDGGDQGEGVGGGVTDSGVTDAGSSGGGTTDEESPDSGTAESEGSNENTADSGDPETTDFTFDVDASGDITALTDGLLIIRHLFGFQGEALITGAVSSGAGRKEAAEISSVIDSARIVFDVDGDGETKALTDGLLIIRYLFGFSGDALLQGAKGSTSPLSGSEILANLQALGQSDSTGAETTGGTSDSGTTDDATSSGEGADGGIADGGAGSTDGGSTDLVDIELSVLYERVFPVIDTSSGFYSARLDYEGAELLPGRLLNVSVFDAETDQEFVPETPWQTDKSGQVTAELPISRQFYFKVYAKTEVEGSDGTWRVSVHDNQGSSSIASYPVYMAVSSAFETNQDRSITLTIESGWTGSGYTETRASGPFAIVDSIVEAMLKVGGSMELRFPPLDVYWSPSNSFSTIGTSKYDQENDTIYILGKEDEDTDEFDAHIVVHEWGHYFQDALSRDDSLGGPHSSGDILDPRVAFSEGWANALSGLVLEDSDYKDTIGAGQSGGFFLPMEEGFPPSVVITSGWFSEDSVGEIVTDLFDATNDAADADNVSLALSEMTKALVGDVKTSPVATTIFSLLAPVIAENASQSSQIDSLLKHHEIALDGPATDVYGSNESQVTTGVTSNALPVFTEIPVDGGPVRICQDKIHRDPSYRESPANLRNMNKLAHRTLGRFTISSEGDYLFSSSSGLQNGVGASTDPDVYIYSSQGYSKGLSVTGPESQILRGLLPGEYWFQAYDYDYLTKTGGDEPCQFVEITSQ